MALIQPEKIRIILEIPDLVIDNTIIKRKAYMLTLIYNQEYNSLCVSWIVKHYSNNNGEYGEYLGNKVPDKLKETIADLSVIVKYPSGEIIEEQDYSLYQDENGDWTINVMYQYDFFNQIGENVDVNIHNLVRSYGMQADWFYNLK